MTISTRPKDDLIRMQTGIRSKDDGRVLYGYAALFNDWTEINSWEGTFRERIAPGAFQRTIQQRGSAIKVLFNHGMDPQIGDKPLGVPTTMREDHKGLYVEVPLDDTSYNRDLKASLASGAIDGMSFRFSVVREEWNSKTDDHIPERTIKELKLYELGPVTFPAYQATTAGVRAQPAFSLWRNATPAERNELCERFNLPTLDLADSGTSKERNNGPRTAHPSKLIAAKRKLQII